MNGVERRYAEAGGDQRRPEGKENLQQKRGSLRETPEVAAGVLRLVAALGKRLADGDPSDLLTLAELDASLDAAWATAVAGQRQAGWTDGDIGNVLGITRQAVEQRWPRNNLEEQNA